jgi:hypothetical protein
MRASQAGMATDLWQLADPMGDKAPDAPPVATSRAATLRLLCRNVFAGPAAARDLRAAGAVPPLVAMLTEPEGPERDADGQWRARVPEDERAPAPSGDAAEVQAAAAELLAALLAADPACGEGVCVANPPPPPPPSARPPAPYPPAHV